MMKVSVEILAVTLCFYFGGFASCAVVGKPFLSRRQQTNDQVDLGYEIYQPTVITDDSVRFLNVRYAAPPVGQNRFGLPQLPSQNREQIQTGERARICLQGLPKWFEDSQIAYEKDQGLTPNAPNVTLIQQVMTEDCLFLDVHVPKSAWENRNAGTKLARTVVHVHGGGYVGGTKSLASVPAPLTRFQDTDIIWVSIAYRLGATGLSAGPEFREQGGVENAALHDLEFALEWVKQHITKFGGDPQNITLMGISAGGGLIEHLNDLYEGAEPARFSQVVFRSPGFYPRASQVRNSKAFKDFLTIANVQSLDDARKIPEQRMKILNAQQIATADPFDLVYSPSVDGKKVPALPSEQMLKKKIRSDLRVMTSEMEDEGSLFVPYNISDPSLSQLFLNNLQELMPWRDQIANQLYPADYGEESGYHNLRMRLAKVISELVFVCNSHYISKAKDNNVHSLRVSAPPSMHGADEALLFYDSRTTAPAAINGNEKTAELLQKAYASFIVTGDPGFAIRGPNSFVQVFSTTGSEPGTLFSPGQDERCAFWQDVLSSISR